MRVLAASLSFLSLWVPLVQGKCPEGQYQTLPLVATCDGAEETYNVDLIKGTTTELAVLPAGIPQVRVVLEAEADLDLRLVDLSNDQCIVGFGCENQEGCDDESDYCINYEGMEIYFSGDAKVDPIREAIYVLGDLTRQMMLEVRGWADTSGQALFSNGEVQDCPEVLPGCALCDSWRGCEAEELPYCDGGPAVVCLPPTSTTTSTKTTTSSTTSLTTTSTSTTETSTSTTTTATSTSTTRTGTTTSTSSTLTTTSSTATTTTETATSTSATKTTTRTYTTITSTTTKTTRTGTTTTVTTTTVTRSTTVTTKTVTTTRTATTKTTTSTSRTTRTSTTTTKTSTSTRTTTTTITTWTGTSTTRSTTTKTRTSTTKTSTFTTTTRTTTVTRTTTSRTVTSTTTTTTTSKTRTTTSSTTTATGTNTTTTVTTTTTTISTTTSTSTSTTHTSTTKTTSTTSTTTHTSTTTSSTTTTCTCSCLGWVLEDTCEDYVEFPNCTENVTPVVPAVQTEIVERENLVGVLYALLISTIIALCCLICAVCLGWRKARERHLRALRDLERSWHMSIRYEPEADRLDEEWTAVSVREAKVSDLEERIRKTGQRLLQQALTVPLWPESPELQAWCQWARENPALTAEQVLEAARSRLKHQIAHEDVLRTQIQELHAERERQAMRRAELEDRLASGQEPGEHESLEALTARGEQDEATISTLRLQLTQAQDMLQQKEVEWAEFGRLQARLEKVARQQMAALQGTGGAGARQAADEAVAAERAQNALLQARVAELESQVSQAAQDCSTAVADRDAAKAAQAAAEQRLVHYAQITKSVCAGRIADREQHERLTSDALRPQPPDVVQPTPRPPEEPYAASPQGFSPLSLDLRGLRGRHLNLRASPRAEPSRGLRAAPADDHAEPLLEAPAEPTAGAGCGMEPLMPLTRPAPQAPSDRHTVRLRGNIILGEPSPSLSRLRASDGSPSVLPGYLKATRS